MIDLYTDTTPNGYKISIMDGRTAGQLEIAH